MSLPESVAGGDLDVDDWDESEAIECHKGRRPDLGVAFNALSAIGLPGRGAET